jgi:D-hydroxyproline dehydrogenase subunit beta
MRVCIIGAGVIGLATASALAQAGQDVTIVDSEQPGAGTSGSTFGRINANDQEPYAYYELKCAGMRAHRRLWEEAGFRTWFNPTGCLKFAQSGSPDATRQSAQDRQLLEWGYSVVHMSGREVTDGIEPALRLSANQEVTYYPDEAFVYPHLFLAYLFRRSLSLGVRCLYGAKVTSLQVRGNRVHSARTSSGEPLDADVFVCCCGRWTEEVLAGTGVRIPLANPGEPDSGAPGLLIYTMPAAIDLTRVVLSPEVNLRPEGGGRLLLHSFSLDSAGVRSAMRGEQPQEALELVDRASHVLGHTPGLALGAFKIGIRPIPEDGLPAIGWAPQLDGLYVIATHHGMTLAPALADLVAREISAEVDEPALSLFRPLRFASRETTLDS